MVSVRDESPTHRGSISADEVTLRWLVVHKVVLIKVLIGIAEVNLGFK